MQLERKEVWLFIILAHHIDRLLLHGTCILLLWRLESLLLISFGNARAELVSKNRHYIKSIVEVLLLCARQDIALRGHREHAESANRGNFLHYLVSMIV